MLYPWLQSLEEKQRRAAREARGEPARNGISVAAAPAKSPWSEQQKSSMPGPKVNENSALLDTFDAESTTSSNGGFAVSTAATSATDGNEALEEEQVARALKASEDESGWQTVNVPKKSKKKGSDGASEAAPASNATVARPKEQARPAQKAVVGKPTGFQALKVEDIGVEMDRNGDESIVVDVGVS